MKNISNILYCPVCGNITHLVLSNECYYCDTLLKETQYDEWESYYRGNLKPEIRKAIEEEYIIGNPQFSEKAKEARLEQQQYDKLNNLSTVSNAVKCPNCKSTNVSKISTVSRVASDAMIGIASGKIGKQWHCNGCGSNF